MNSKFDLTGRVFGRLTVIERAGSVRNNRAWICRCECGTTKTLLSPNLTLEIGGTKSCGCLRRDARKTHGYARIHDTAPEYKIWVAIKDRTTKEHNKSYASYGGRGIDICERWRNSFQAFIDDVGRRPEKSLTLDRIDNNGNYEPGNCRWATRKTQSSNRRVTLKLTWNNETLSIADWAAKTGMSYRCLYSRIHKGWSTERAMTTPVGKDWANRKIGNPKKDKVRVLKKTDETPG